MAVGNRALTGERDDDAVRSSHQRWRRSAPWALEPATADRAQGDAGVPDASTHNARLERSFVERQLTITQAQTHVGAWSLDVGAARTTWTLEMFRLHGASPGDGTPDVATWLQFVHADDRDAVAALLHDLTVRGGRAELDYRTSPTRGRVHRLLLRAAAELDPAGHVIEVLGTVHDVTERRDVELRVRDMEARTGALVAALPDTVLMLDRHGRLVDLGLPSSPPAGADLASILPAELAGAVHDAVSAAWAAGDAGTAEREAPGADGAVFEIRAVSLGDRAGAVVVLRDVTTRVRSEAALRASTERHARMWERLLAAQDEERRRIARELHDQAGSSLAAMLVSCRLLEDACDRADVRALVGALRGELTSTLDDLARLARGLHPVVLDELGLGPALTRVATSLTRDQGIALELAIELDGRRLRPALEVALFRIAQESLTNVRRHAAARHVRVACRVIDGIVVLAIEDDGRGFDSSALERFVRSDRLGLAGLRDRAALLGGQATILSGEGRGTRVEIRIPCDPPMAAEAAPRTTVLDPPRTPP